MDERVRLLVVGIAWPPETFLARLIDGLLQTGVEVTVACSQKPDTSWLRRKGFSWLFTPSWDESVIHRLLYFGLMGSKTLLRTGPGMRRWMNMSFSNGSGPFSRWKARGLQWYRLLPFVGRTWDVIYFPWNSAAIAYRPLFDTGIPVVVSCRGSQINVAPHNPRRFSIREGLRETFRRAAAVHCVSEAIKREAMQYGLDPAKAWVIRPAVDPNFFHPAEPRSRSDKGVFRVITTGSLIWHKGYEYALMAIRQLVDAEVPVRLDIIGDGPERQRVLYTIHDLGLENHVRLLGRLSPEQVRDRLQQANVFLLSSLSEGISNAVLEAMACSLPVVTTDCGGMREAVTDGVEGFVVPVRDPEAMARALMRLWKDKELRQRMGGNARKRVLKEFALKKHIEQWHALITAICQK